MRTFQIYLTVELSRPQSTQLAAWDVDVVTNATAAAKRLPANAAGASAAAIVSGAGSVKDAVDRFFPRTYFYHRVAQWPYGIKHL